MSKTSGEFFHRLRFLCSFRPKALTHRAESCIMKLFIRLFLPVWALCIL